MQPPLCGQIHLKMSNENCLCRDVSTSAVQSRPCRCMSRSWSAYWKTGSLTPVPLGAKLLSPLIRRRYFFLSELYNATITIFFLLACFHRSACGQLWARAILLLWLLVLHILFQFKKHPLVCCEYVHSCWSLIFTSSMDPLPPHPFAPTLCRVLWWITEQSLVILYGRCIKCMLITLLLVCCGCKCTPITAKFYSGPIPAAKCRRKKKVVTLNACSCGVTQTAQPDYGFLASNPAPSAFGNYNLLQSFLLVESIFYPQLPLTHGLLMHCGYRANIHPPT